MEARTTHIDIAEVTARGQRQTRRRSTCRYGAPLPACTHSFTDRPGANPGFTLAPAHICSSVKARRGIVGQHVDEATGHKTNQPGIVELTVVSGLTEMSGSVRQSEPPRTASSALRDPTSWAGPGNATGRTAHPSRDLETSWLARSRPHRCQAVPTEAIGRCRASHPAC